MIAQQWFLYQKIAKPSSFARNKPDGKTMIGSKVISDQSSEGKHETPCSCIRTTTMLTPLQRRFFKV